ncbi:hypothetical protein B1757_14660 [Acidithiobacillus marinus]|uniref:DUF2782 domain-containing protein n=1 Tax=Acidithiobacillus marinus TaxID=187490 RepID=A0A2I1DHX7_9PROT|nr:DUF2782 domain-containing protein [Acidithiobacillus marinus]PKY09478.1 hypothetical protein B1757_14660 [Acidithiobacillus marinus]
MSARHLMLTLVATVSLGFAANAVADLDAALPNSAQNNIKKLHLPKLAPHKIGPNAEIQAPTGSKIEEYKVNGRVYMVKVIPPKPFPPYYLEDKGGNGRFTEVPQTDAEHLSVPQWILFRW